MLRAVERLKPFRGLVITCPISIDKDGTYRLRSSLIDPHELRRSLLFWDKLAWPQTGMIKVNPSSPELEFLEGEGILLRPEAKFKGNFNGIGDQIAKQHVSSFIRLEEVNPGAWALAEGPKSFHWELSTFDTGRGTLVSLHRSIPVPEMDVPLEEVLRFKEKRSSEMLALRSAMDDFYGRVINSGDPSFEMNSAISQIDEGCVDAIRVAKEENFKIRLSDLKFNFSMSFADLMAVSGAAVGGAGLGAQFGLESLGALIGGALPFLTISKGGSMSGLKDSQKPFRYVGQIHNDVI